MNPGTRIEIPLSKGKLIALILSCILFVAIGAWILAAQPTTSNPVFNNPLLKNGAGVLSIVFFGFCLVLYIRKLSDKKPGIIIDETGITDNASAIPAGHISWNDIQRISTTRIMNQSFITVEVRNPEKYIERQQSALKRKAMQSNLKQYGTPVFITVNGLKYSFKKLYALLEEQFRIYGHGDPFTE